jgi:hypothetical protein
MNNDAPFRIMFHATMRGVIAVAALGVAWVVCAAPARAAGSPPPAGAESTEVRFTVNERALLDCLRAVTPQTVTVGSSLLSTELTLLDPADLVLANGRASFRIRVKGRTIPLDQVVNPTVTIDKDPRSGQFFGVISSLPVQVPGLGSIDLKDYLPRFEIPALLEDLWHAADRPIGLRLRIRRIAILDHLLEVGADVDFAPTVSSRGTGPS